MAVQTRIQVRRDTASNWTSTNPTLAAGEFGFETDTTKVKIGNGSTAWTSLGYVGGSTVSVSDTPPSTPTAGSIWFESDTARTYIYYDSSWIEIGALAPSAIVSDTAPSAPEAGQLWFNSLNGGTYIYYDSVWTEVGAVPVNALLNTINAKGDLLVGTADNTVGRLPVGTNGFFLKANSSASAGVEWTAVTTDVMTDTKNAALIIMDIGA
jgi:hypothetical protein